MLRQLFMSWKNDTIFCNKCYGTPSYSKALLKDTWADPDVFGKFTSYEL
ncbi:unnamed protein product [Acanthoscelides obtectus]|uniref:Uncharacterized protein n=1 Tax=Acanthoscelides obtectus TaxID=200917 RepID=A0A9P0LGP2_ACAOB|nr:unnamed protein product [Acanthoscelides obtectus]CAK1674275.1 hypothetical protein AOBTE_LOCUS29576 [Acanthoscelides obtectus]